MGIKPLDFCPLPFLKHEEALCITCESAPFRRWCAVVVGRVLIPVFRHCTNLAISLIALSVVTAGCVVMPEPIPSEHHTERSRQDLEKLRSVEFVPTKPIELHEAMARAVATALASVKGSRKAAISIPVPNFRVLVEVAMAAMATHGSAQGALAGHKMVPSSL